MGELPRNPKPLNLAILKVENLKFGNSKGGVYYDRDL